MAAPSSPEIIVIDDDDDFEVSNQPYDIDNDGAEKSAMVETFMEIMNQSRSDARAFLQSHQFQLEQAIAARLEEDDQKARQQQNSQITLHNTHVDQKVPAAAAAPAKPCVTSSPSRKRPRGQQSLIDNDVNGLRHHRQHKQRHVSKDMLQQDTSFLTTSSLYFRDTDYPPELQSLDGRKRTHNNHSDKPPTTTHCHCGLPASARQVQSDGSNYGKFYLGCGRTLAKKLQSSNSSLTNASNNPNHSLPSPCNFFQWDKQGVKGAQLLADQQKNNVAMRDGYGATRFALLTWQHFGKEHGNVLYNTSTGIDPSQVRQGAVGNCWFLSALAVVAEKPYLIQQLLPHTELNDSGCYQVNLCLDGRWTSVVVDSYLPVVIRDRSTSGKMSHKRQHTLDIQLQNRDCVPYSMDSVAFPAFCATPHGQLWAALVEKAYSKVHGSFAQLSGGFICEGLFDLTGAPCETIVLQGEASIDRDLLWARLLSFHEAGFLMGVATNKGGDGLVGGHAYSVLDVIEVSGKVIGEQKRVTEYFDAQSKTKHTTVCRADSHSKETLTNADNRSTRETIRLVRIRNPWGKREWKGAWSASSEQWTKALRKALGKSSYARGDGTFFMSFDDVLERFHHMDVGKTRQGWILSSADASFRGQRDPLHSCSFVYKLLPAERTSAFISIVQPKKRSQAGNDYWYVDPNFIILRRRNRKHWPEAHDHWTCEVACIEGVKRISTHEVILNPEEYEYVVVPFSSLATRKQNGASSSFRVCCYSAHQVSIAESNQGLNDYYAYCASALHTRLLEAKRKHAYRISQSCALLCLHAPGCLYIVALNGTSDAYLSIKLNLQIPRKGIIASFGCNGGTIDIAPKSQRILFVAMGDGKLSAATRLPFSYLTDIVVLRSTTSNPARAGGTRRNGLGSNIDLSFAAESYLSTLKSSPIRAKGGDIIDTYLWIPQLGASQSYDLPESQSLQGEVSLSTRSTHHLTSSEKSSIYAEARRPLNILHEQMARLKRELQGTARGSTEYRRIESEIEILQHALIPAAKTKSCQLIWQTLNTAGDLALMNHRGNVELDFHGLHQDEAKMIFDDMIIPFLPHVGSFHLIVGKGKHSQGKIAKIKPALYDHIFAHEKSKHITCSQVKGNPGVLEVALAKEVDLVNDS